MIARVIACLCLGCAVPILAAEPLDKDKSESEYAPYKNYVATDRMIEFYQGEIKKDPKSFASYALLGYMHLRKARESGDLGGYDRADEAFRRALELQRGYAAALVGQASVLQARHQFAEALRLAQDLLRKYPNERGLLVLAADAQFELGEYDKAEKAFQEVQKSDPLATLHSRWARMAELKGKTDEALDWLAKAVEDEAPSALTPEGRAWYPFRLGEICFNAGRLDKAAAHLEEARRLHPRYPMTLIYLGKLRTAQGKLDEAIKLYAQAAGLSAELSMLADLGDLYARTGKDFLAKLNHDKLVEVGRKQGVYARELSLFFANHDRDLPEALALARKDLAVRKDIHAYDTLAWALCKNKQFSEAAAAMSQALKLGTQDASLFYHAGMIHAGLGDKDKARDYLKRALALNPHFSLLQADRARQALRDLER